LEEPEQIGAETKFVVEKQENKLEFTLQAEKTIRFNQKRKHRP
jgi:hypothetical protein